MGKLVKGHVGWRGARKKSNRLGFPSFASQCRRFCEDETRSVTIAQVTAASQVLTNSSRGKLLPARALYSALFVLWRRDRHVSEQAGRIGREVATCAVKHFGVAVAVIEDARPDAEQDDVLPARLLHISEETAVIVIDADGPGFNVGD